MIDRLIHFLSLARLTERTIHITDNTTPCLCLDWFRLFSSIRIASHILYIQAVHLFNCLQNATIATPVFQVIASDPDNAMTPSGTLSFRIQDDIEDASAFKIGKIYTQTQKNTI